LRSIRLRKVKKNLVDELRINQDTVFIRARKLLLNKTVAKAVLGLKSESKLTSSVLESISTMRISLKSKLR
jgi:hypothetical protein